MTKRVSANSVSSDLQGIDIHQLRTVGVFLCPYRYLTTLTAATLALHRNVQVMNHGGRRLFEAGALKFFVHPDDATYARFCTSLIELSCGGARGNFGGSITFSHAFDHQNMREAYERRFSGELMKCQIRSILWKEGGVVQSLFWKGGIDPVSLSERFPQLRFLSPIRNPLDHALGLQKYYKNGIWGPVQDFLKSTNLEDLFRYLLTAHESFFVLHERAPDRFLYFFEDEIGPDLARRLAEFLETGDDPEWEKLVPEVMTNAKQYAPKNEDLFKAILYSEFAGAKSFISHMERALTR
jgi:hypothetical protein